MSKLSMLLSVSLLILFSILFSATATSAAESKLRMEEGMHSGPIRLVVSDARGRYLGTTGDDSTVRIWDAVQGRLLKTLYLPERAGSVPGRQPVALSPDGQTVALISGGQLILLDWRTAQVRARIQLAEPITRLLFAPLDSGTAQPGGRIAAISESGIVTLFETRDGNQLARLPCEGACVDLDFDGSGRLLTLAEAGGVRIYDARLQSIAEGKLPQKMRQARLSPDGSRIAASTAEGGLLSVYSVPDLRLLYQPDLRGMQAAPAILIAWSATGSSLYASAPAPGAGSPRRGLLRRWSAAGQGAFVDMLKEEPALTALLPLPQECVAFAADAPALGMVAANQQLMWRRQRALPDFSLPDSTLQVDGSGSNIRFSAGGGIKIAFSISDRSVQKNVPFGVRYATAASEGAGWRLSGWPQAPQQDGVALPLLSQESVRCRALTPALPDAAADRARLFVGTDRALVAFDQQGRARWRNEIREGVHLAAVSGDGQLVIAGLSDGSLRWYAAADGRELLGLFLAMERGTERWIVFTPSGYYDAAVNGEALLGLEVSYKDRSTDDFFPISAFRAQRHRPELLSRVLSSRDEERSLGELDAERGRTADRLPLDRMLPPSVSILDPGERVRAKGAPLTLRVLVRASDPAPIQLRAFVEGRMAQTRGLRLVSPDASAEGTREQIYDVSVDVPADDCTVTVIAAMGERKSEPASLHLRGATAPDNKRAARPDLYMLAIGVGNYAQDHLRLQYPSKDARDLARTLREQQGRQYGQVFIRELLEREASRDNILAGLAWLRSQTTAKDVAVLFLAGHGISDPADGRYYFLPADADLSSPESTMVDAGQIQAALASTRGRVLLLLDTCHSGNVLVGRGGPRATDFSRVVNEMASADSGVVVYAASSGTQASQESARWNNGAFTKAIIEGLRGKADYTASGRVTVSALEHYVGERVRQLTGEVQTPTTAKPTTIADFSIAQVSSRGGVFRKPWFWTLVGLTVAAGAATAIGLSMDTKGPDTSGLPALRPFAN